MKYLIVEAQSILSLEDQVIRRCSEGWIPQGGVTVYVAGGYLGNRFLQAMIKNETPGFQFPDRV